MYFRDDGTLRFAECQREVVAKANDPEHAHRLAAPWNAFLQAETTEIERIDDGLSDIAGKGMLAIAKALGVGTSTVQRIAREMEAARAFDGVSTGA